MAYYNPIVRSFCRVRAALVELGVDRRAVRPDASLESLVPRSLPEQLLERLLPAERPIADRDDWGCIKGALLVGVLGGCWLAQWLGPIVILLLPALLILLLFCLDRAESGGDPANGFPIGLRTVGELAIWTTSFREHRDSGYRWTCHEIALKVRMITAEQFGCRLDEIQPDTAFIDLAS